MGFNELIKTLKRDKKMLTGITVLGVTGMCLIMISAIIPDDKQEEVKSKSSEVISSEYGSYCRETEERLTEFLKEIEGVGEVKVYITVSGEEEYKYAKESRTSVSDNKKEEEESYVMVGGSGDKTALIETIALPRITGAVIACTGSDSASVQEMVYKTASTALGIPTSKIYVTKLR